MWLNYILNNKFWQKKVKTKATLATIMKINFDQVICYCCSTFAEIGMIHIICLNKLVCCLQLDLLDKKCKKLHHMKLVNGDWNDELLRFSNMQKKLENICFLWTAIGMLNCWGPYGQWSMIMSKSDIFFALQGVKTNTYVACYTLKRK